MSRLVHQRIGTALQHAKNVVEALSAVQDDDSDVKAQLAECVKALRTVETSTRPAVDQLSASGAKFVLRQLHGISSATLRKVGL